MDEEDGAVGVVGDEGVDDVGVVVGGDAKDKVSSKSRIGERERVSNS